VILLFHSVLFNEGDVKRPRFTSGRFTLNRTELCEIRSVQPNTLR